MWSFDGGLDVPASASPDIVPLPMSIPANVDPEEAFVASVASCHMLFFLALAQEQGLSVARYQDRAFGKMGKNAGGKLAVTQIVLRPSAEYGSGAGPDREQVERLHHQAHERCFIANSVLTDIAMQIVS